MIHAGKIPVFSDERRHGQGESTKANVIQSRRKGVSVVVSPGCRCGFPGATCFSDRSDHPCTGTAFSPGNLQLEGPVIGAVGERAVCHFEHLGRLEGEIVRPTAGGFVMSIQASRQRRLKLADQLTWWPIARCWDWAMRGSGAASSPRDAQCESGSGTGAS